MRALVPGLVATVLLSPILPVGTPLPEAAEVTGPTSAAFAPAVLNDNRTPAGAVGR